MYLTNEPGRTPRNAHSATAAGGDTVNRFVWTSAGAKRHEPAALDRRPIAIAVHLPVRARLQRGRAVHRSATSPRAAAPRSRSAAGPATVTYAGLAENVNRCGNTLLGLGLEPGQRMLILVKDSPEFFYLFWAQSRPASSRCRST